VASLPSPRPKRQVPDPTDDRRPTSITT
jgi:hypothetical protein